MILVTGGTGLVGSHLLYQICQSETKVRAIKKRAQSNTSLVRQIFSYYTEKADLLFQIEWVNADLLNIPELELAFQGIQKCITAQHGLALTQSAKKNDAD